jgi:hypothetical protein
VKFNAFMIHACGTFDGEKGRIFAGFSGSGKTTLSSLWRFSGSNIVNDDRLIVAKEKGNYFMYNSPMFIVDDPKKMPLHSLYIIRHSKQNNIKQIKGVSSVSRLMAFCVQHNYNQQFIKHHLDILHDICSNLPVYEIGFVADEKIIDFIKEHGV